MHLESEGGMGKGKGFRREAQANDLSSQTCGTFEWKETGRAEGKVEQTDGGKGNHRPSHTIRKLSTLVGTVLVPAMQPRSL